MIRDNGVQSRGRRALRAVRFALVGAGVVGLSGCTDAAGYDLDYFWGNIPALATLRGSVAFDPYEMPRLPAEHTVPVASPIGDVPPPFGQAALDSAAATLTNPYGTNPSPEVLAVGQRGYIGQCAPCHGPQGAGNGTVVGPGKYPFAPAINGATTAARSDGYLYGVIVVGRGLMPQYLEKLSHTERWAVVSYVRHLQATGEPLPQGAAGVPTVVNPPESAAPGAPAPAQQAPAQPGAPAAPADSAPTAPGSR